MPKQTRLRGNKAKGRRSAHHKLTGKYTRQRIRTTANKAKRKARLFSLLWYYSLRRLKQTLRRVARTVNEGRNKINGADRTVLVIGKRGP